MQVNRSQVVKKKHSLYRMVYRTLRGRILSGEYEVGDQIETEPELAEQFHTSLITIRQAAQMLSDEGLLDKQQGRGTFVPLSVRSQRKILCVCGLDLTQGLRRKMGTYHADLLVLSQEETARRGMEFEAVWLSHFNPDRCKPYCEEPVLREYWGFVFIACRPDHPMVQRVRKLKMRYAMITSGEYEGHRCVWLDYREAIRLALDECKGREGGPVVVMGIDSMGPVVESILKETGGIAETVYIPGSEGGVSFETEGYLRTRELVRSGRDLSRVIFLDDIVAQGATRALLEAGYGARNPRLVIIAGRQEIIPLGIPATYVVHDTVESARQAFQLLEQPIRGAGANHVSWRSGFRVLSPEELAVNAR